MSVPALPDFPLALMDPASGHFWQIQSNPAPVKFLAGLPDLPDLNVDAVSIPVLFTAKSNETSLGLSSFE